MQAALYGAIAGFVHALWSARKDKSKQAISILGTQRSETTNKIEPGPPPLNEVDESAEFRPPTQDSAANQISSPFAQQISKREEPLKQEPPSLTEVDESAEFIPPPQDSTGPATVPILEQKSRAAADSPHPSQNVAAHKQNQWPLGIAVGFSICAAIVLISLLPKPMERTHSVGTAPNSRVSAFANDYSNKTHPEQPQPAEATPSPPSNLSSEDYFNSASRKQANGDWIGAIIDYDKAIALHPDFAVAYYDRGIAKQAKGDSAGALADYNKAIELKPDFPEAQGARHNLIKANSGLGGASSDFTSTPTGQQPQATEVVATPAANLSAEDYFSTGYTKQINGDLNGAIVDYNKVIELKPDYTRARAARDNLQKTITSQSANPGPIANQDSTQGKDRGISNDATSSQSPQLQEVVNLTKAKMSDDVILTYIKNSSTSYDLSANDILYLNSQAVTAPMFRRTLNYRRHSSVSSTTCVSAKNYGQHDFGMLGIPLPS